MATIPTIDFTPFNEEAGVVVGEAPTAGQREVAAQIDRACRDHGFLRLVNLGLEAREIEAAFAASSELFGLPDEAKAGLAAHTPEDNLGFVPLASETTGGGGRNADAKEAYEVGFPGVRNNNFQGCPRGFQAMVEGLWERVNRAGRRYCVACELALGLESGFFLRTFSADPGPDLCTMKFLHCELTPPLPPRTIPLLHFC